MEADPASGSQSRRAVVLVGHGGVPRDYPRDRLLRLRGLDARRRASGARPSDQEAALEADIRHRPRTPATDPYQAALEGSVAEAVRALAAEGVTDIIAMPSMLAPGGVHTELEIPESIDALRVELPHLDIRYARPFAVEGLAALFVEHPRQLDLP